MLLKYSEPLHNPVAVGLSVYTGHMSGHHLLRWQGLMRVQDSANYSEMYTVLMFGIFAEELQVNFAANTDKHRHTLYGNILTPH